MFQSFGDFECSICHMRFAEKKVLKNHFGTHSRRYQCQKCEKILHFKTTMATHLLRHENTYVCNTCGHRSEYCLFSKHYIRYRMISICIIIFLLYSLGIKNRIRYIKKLIQARKLSNVPYVRKFSTANMTMEFISGYLSYI